MKLKVSLVSLRNAAPGTNRSEKVYLVQHLGRIRVLPRSQVLFCIMRRIKKQGVLGLPLANNDPVPQPPPLFRLWRKFARRTPLRHLRHHPVQLPRYLCPTVQSRQPPQKLRRARSLLHLLLLQLHGHLFHLLLLNLTPGLLNKKSHLLDPRRKCRRRFLQHPRGFLRFPPAYPLWSLQVFLRLLVFLLRHRELLQKLHLPRYLCSRHSRRIKCRHRLRR